MPRKKAKSKMYFTQDTEDAIIAYRHVLDQNIEEFEVYFADELLHSVAQYLA